MVVDLLKLLCAHGDAPLLCVCWFVPLRLSFACGYYNMMVLGCGPDQRYNRRDIVRDTQSGPITPVSQRERRR